MRQPPLAVRFGPFTLDDEARTLRRGTAAIHLSPKAFDLLALLVRRRPAAIAKAELHQQLWPDTFVSDGNLAVLVAEIRQALGDSARESTFIRTVQRFGYAFSGMVDEAGAVTGTRREAAACWIVWGVRRPALDVGENILGRDRTVHVNIDAVGVSRQHAMIVFADDGITLVDLGARTAPSRTARV